MNRRRVLSLVASTVAILSLMAVPSHGVTSWRTKSTTISKGAAGQPTLAMTALSVTNPHAVRVGVATRKGESKAVRVDWMLDCASGESKEASRRVVTKTDGSLTWVTVVSGGGDLGSSCMVMTITGMPRATTQLRTVLQVKHR